MIALGSDHGGFELKQQIKNYLDEKNIQYKDYGCHESKSCDYPDMAIEPCKAVLSNQAEKAILICGTGIGISIAANKINGIRAAVCSDYFSAKYTRLHNDANVLCLGGRVVGAGLATELVDIFLNTEFEGTGRHKTRIDKYINIENQEF